MENLNEEERRCKRKQRKTAGAEEKEDKNEDINERKGGRGERSENKENTGKKGSARGNIRETEGVENRKRRKLIKIRISRRKEEEGKVRIRR